MWFIVFRPNVISWLDVYYASTFQQLSSILWWLRENYLMLINIVESCGGEVKGTNGFTSKHLLILNLIKIRSLIFPLIFWYVTFLCAISEKGWAMVIWYMNGDWLS